MTYTTVFVFRFHCSCCVLRVLIYSITSLGCITLLNLPWCVCVCENIPFTVMSLVWISAPAVLDTYKRWTFNKSALNGNYIWLLEMGNRLQSRCKQQKAVSTGQWDLQNTLLSQTKQTHCYNTINVQLQHDLKWLFIYLYM